MPTKSPTSNASSFCSFSKPFLFSYYYYLPLIAGPRRMQITSPDRKRSNTHKKCDNLNCKAMHCAGDKKVIQVIIVQKQIRSFLARRLRNRLLIANEIVRNEELYLDRLSIVVNNFYQHLKQINKDAGCIFGGTIIDTTFSIFEKIWNHQRQFFEVLRARVADWQLFSKKGLGDVFVDHTQFWNLYEFYFEDYKQFTLGLKRCQHDVPWLSKLIKQVYKSPSFDSVFISCFIFSS